MLGMTAQAIAGVSPGVAGYSTRPRPGTGRRGSRAALAMAMTPAEGWCPAGREQAPTPGRPDGVLVEVPGGHADVGLLLLAGRGVTRRQIPRTGQCEGAMGKGRA